MYQKGKMGNEPTDLIPVAAKSDAAWKKEGAYSIPMETWLNGE